MFEPTRLTVLSRCLALVSSVVLTGCVTTGDVEKIESRLSERLQAMESQSRSQAAALRMEVQGLQTGQDSLSKDLTQALKEVGGEAKVAVKQALEAELGPLRQQLQAIEAQSRSRRAALQAELKELRREHDMVRREVTQAFAQVQREAKSAVAEISQNRQALARFADQTAQAFDRFVGKADRLRAQITDFHRGLMQSLVGSYQAEEATLRERLRAIVDVRQQLEAVAGSTERDSPQLTEQAEARIKRAEATQEAVE